MAHDRPRLRLLRMPRRIAGYTDLGLPRFPPVPTGTVFTDRTSGSLYLLSHNSATDAVVLTTPPPAQWNGRAFGPREGPVLSSPVGLLRLYVDGGVLLSELAPEDWTGRADARVLTRNFAENKIVYEVTAPSGWELGDALTVTRVLG